MRVSMQRGFSLCVRESLVYVVGPCKLRFRGAVGCRIVVGRTRNKLVLALHEKCGLVRQSAQDKLTPLAEALDACKADPRKHQSSFATCRTALALPLLTLLLLFPSLLLLFTTSMKNLHISGG